LAAIGSNINIVTFERLQFKTATANNGKRRAAQQYYEIVINLYANVSHQKSPILVATCNSDPLVVRGRSPGHYSDSHSQRNSSSQQQQHHMSTASSNNNNNSEANSSNNMAVNSNVSISSSSSSTSIVGNDRNRLVDKYQLSPPLPSQQQPQQQNKYTNLPNTPISEIGSYASYGNFTYQATPNFSPVVSSQSTPSSSNIPHYATNTLPSPNGQPYSYMNSVSCIYMCVYVFLWIFSYFCCRNLISNNPKYIIITVTRTRLLQNQLTRNLIVTGLSNNLSTPD
jgi:hypothetical protein